MTKAAFTLRGRNPDVLSCIANLSNDEVFTPPEFANRMLETLAEAWAADNAGASIWANPDITFLDPFTKSGVFLREITKRLIDGLEPQIPDLQARVDHILTRQVYGIAITDLTAMLARRSLYCSKHANGEHSIARSFKSDAGNIWFERVEHTWRNGKCKFCGASKVAMDRGEELESHAYVFIHTEDIKKRVSALFGEQMQFDVIIGNPPYQMSGGGGGTNDSAIYHIFIEQAMKLEPRYLSMVIPSRWMAGGRGLNDFRASFLGDNRLKVLVDFENAKDVFPSVGIGGGACYFLWDREHRGACTSLFYRGETVIGPVERRLDEFDVFVRDARALEILRKVTPKTADFFSSLVSGDTPFGLATNFTQYKRDAKPNEDEVLIYANMGTKRVTGSVKRELIKKNTSYIDTWKLFLPVAGSGRERERSGVDLVIGPPILASPGSVCTQTYLCAGGFETERAAKSALSYIRTRFARFLISLRKPAQHVFRGMYQWVPIQTWDRNWTDEALYEKYRLTNDEIAMIEKFVRPMEPDLFSKLADE